MSQPPHQANGTDLSGLIFIEYGFHVTLMITGLVLARFFLATLRQARAVPVDNHLVTGDDARVA